MGMITSRDVSNQLNITYSGKLRGKLGDNNAILQSNHNLLTESPFKSSISALDSMLIKKLLESLGDPEDAYLIKTNDLASFSINIISPLHSEYKPVFFDRANEYGSDHIYYEALCHSLPHREVILSSSARYFNSKDGISLLTKHLPTPLPITAFIECFRNINSNFLQDLNTSLSSLSDTLTPEDDSRHTMVKEFMDGAFRNIAIQIHYKGSSYERPMLYHMDHVFSALHMAVTLNGQRMVGFAKERETFDTVSEVTLFMQPGDIYITTPAGIVHGVSTDDLSLNERSVALQCRTLLGNDSAKYWSKHVPNLCIEISKVLAKWPLKMPSYSEWEVEYQKLLENRVEPNEKFYLFEQEKESKKE